MKKTITRIYVYSVLILFLLFTGFSGYSNIFTSKCVAFTSLSLVYIIFYSVLGIPTKKLGFSEISALAYLGISALSAFASSHFPQTLIGISRYEGLLTIGIYVAVFLFVSESWSQDRYFPYVLSSVMLVESLIVIFQLLGFNVLWLYPNGENYYIALEKYNGAFISTIGNADIASAVFSLMTPILWGIFITNKKYRFITLISATASTVCLVFMSVSAGIVAMFALLLIIPTVLFPEKRKMLFALLPMVLIAVAVAVYFLPIEDGMVYELQALMRGNYDADFGSGRLHIWSEVVENVRPLLGTGPDTMLRENIEPFVKNINGKEVVRRIDIAHNDYLNILFHQGIFAFIAFLGILAPLFVAWLRNGRSNKTVTLLGAGAFAYSVQIFFSYSACSSAVFFWIILGIINSEVKSGTTSCAVDEASTQHRAV